jgi:hypothetical protein
MRNTTIASKSARLPAALVAGLVGLLLAGAALARAETVGNGDLLVAVSGELRPHTLPRSGTAPVSVQVGGQISTTDETKPPQLRELEVEINRQGRFDYAGLPTCKISKIQPASDARALANCRSALVGEGTFSGTLTLPGSEPYPIAGRLLVFNGREGGHPVLLGHIYTPQPFGTSFVIRFQITTKKAGTYGTVLTANLASALGEKRSLTAIEMKLSRRFSYRGARRSYLSAGCPAPKGFRSAPYKLARTTFSFADGRKLTTVLNRTCGARG